MAGGMAGRARLYAGLSAGLVAAALLLPLPPGAEPASRVNVPWQAADGALWHVGLTRASVDAFLAQRETRLLAEQDALVAEVTRAIDAELAVLFGGLLSRLPAYADWVYGWIDSYIAAYRVLGGFAREQLETRGADPAGTLNAKMQAVAKERFEALVLAPVLQEEALDAASRRLHGLLDHTWRQSLARDEAAWEAFLTGEPSRSARPAPAASSPAPPHACDAASLAAVDESGRRFFPGPDRITTPEQSDLLALRFGRPFAARGAILAVRLGMGFGGAAFPAGPLALIGQVNPGVVTAVIATTAVLWCGDYLINYIDGALNRATFEAELVDRLSRTQASERAYLARQLAVMITTAYASTLKCSPAVQAMASRG